MLRSVFLDASSRKKLDDEKRQFDQYQVQARRIADYIIQRYTANKAQWDEKIKSTCETNLRHYTDEEFIKKLEADLELKWSSGTTSAPKSDLLAVVNKFLEESLGIRLSVLPVTYDKTGQTCDRRNEWTTTFDRDGGFHHWKWTIEF